MRRSNRLIVLGILLGTAMGVSAADAPKPDTGWMAGDWCGGEEGERLQESWTNTEGRESIGMARTLRGGRMIVFEFMRIVDRDGVLTYVAQPNGEPPTYFKRTDGGADWVRFENKEHDYPQRIEYRRDGEALLAEIGGPGAGDKEEVISYRYTRCPAGSP